MKQLSKSPPPHICGPNKNNISSALTLEFVGYVRVNFAR